MDSANGYIYVAATSSDTVSVIDGATDTVIDSIPVGSAPWGVAVDSANGYLYATNRNSNNVTVINGAKNTVIGSIPVGNAPQGVTVDPLNGYIYVANGGTDNVTVINGATDKVVESVPVGNGPNGIAFDPLNGYIYVANNGGINVTVINGATSKVVGSVPVSSPGVGPWGIAVDPVNGYIYVGDAGCCSPTNVTVINGKTDTVIGSIPVGVLPVDIAVNRANGYVYVVDYGSGNVTVINGLPDTVVGSIRVGSSPDGVAVDPLNGLVYVSNQGSGNLTVFGGNTSAVVGSITLAVIPEGVALDSANGNVYVTEMSLDTVAVVNGTTDAVVGSIPVGSTPWGLAFDPLNGYIYVTNRGSGSVTVINGTTDTVVGSIPVGENPQDVAVDRANGYVYVANFGSWNVTVINGTTDEVVGSIGVSGYASGVAVNTLNGYVYVTHYNYGYNNPYGVAIINGTTDTMVGDIALGAEPDAVAVDDANGYVYVASGSVVVIDGATNTVIGSIPVGGGPDSIAVDSLNGYVYVENYWSDNVSVINGATDEVVGSIAVGNTQYWGWVACDPLNGYIYATDSVSGSVSVISPETAVTFTESGLPPGTSWSVTLGGSTVSSTNGTIMFTELNGVYTYTVWSVSGYTASPSSGSVTVKGVPLTQQIVFPTPVTFTESGLPPGTSWSVTLGGSTGSSTNTSIVFTEWNGVYSYTVGSVTGYVAHPSSGSVTVTGVPLRQSIVFLGPERPVTFAETGLPTGTSWSVTLNGTTENSTGPSIVFMEPNGTYSFYLGPVAGYAVSPPSGTITVAGAPVTQAILWLSTYPVVFNETGLPQGSNWSVTLNRTTLSTTASSIAFYLPNGTYSFTVGEVRGYTASVSSGTVIVSGKASTLTVTFSASAKAFPWLIAGALTLVIVSGILAGLHFTRISRETVFQTKVRRVMYDYVESKPGASFSEIRDTLGLQNGRASYHLRVLEKQGFLHSETKRRRHMYYTNGNASLWRDLPVSSLQDSILRAVRETPGVGVRDLGRILDRGPTSVSYNVRVLSREGLLRVERSGLRVQCYPPDTMGG